MMRSVRILMVEDNPADVDLTLDSLTVAGFCLEFDLARDGVEAMSMLNRQGRFSAARRPDLVLLDLNLPKKDGRQVLAELKGTESLKGIPVVVLTSSDAERDVVESYRLGANCYVKKPFDLAAFRDVVKAIENFWFSLVKLPSGGRI